MPCENCFNGCADITSDKCVKYTGLPITLLNIDTGDSLLMVEQKITDKIVAMMSGAGIIPILNPDDICAEVQSLMPCCPPINLNQILTVYVKAICRLNEKNEELKEQVRVVESAINELNSNYTIFCLEDVSAESDTHDIVQAIITKLCDVENSLSLYVPLDQLSELIADYIATTVPTDLMSNRMVPYVANAYFGDITLFGTTGAGSGVWDRVFICNGQNGTPDLRGRTLVGTTNIGTLSLSPIVDPAIAGNPAYVIDPVTGPSTVGTNSVILNVDQMPDHNHNPVIAISTDSGHTHRVPTDGYTREGGSSNTPVPSTGFNDFNVFTESGAANITTTVTLTANGGGDAHPNIQPSTATYYIMYIPA